MTKRFTLPAAVFLLLQNDGGEILLARRFNTGHADGQYGLPAGHIDGNESLAQAMCRETAEELGIRIKQESLSFVHTQHVREIHVPPFNKEYINFVFSAKDYAGTPTIMEPNKCDDLLWCKTDQLPENTISYVREMIEHWQQNQTFSELGW